jgi:hypothetical protein
MSKKEEITKAAADLVLRELNEIEARDVFGGVRNADGDGDGGGWVKVGPIEPVPN